MKTVLEVVIVSLVVILIETLCVMLGWNVFLIKAFDWVEKITIGQAFWLSLAISFIFFPICNGSRRK